MISKMRLPVRRTMNGAKKIQVIACLGEAFWAWRAKLGVVPFAVGTSWTGDRGWVAVAKANDRRSVHMAARRLECTAARQLAKLGWCVTEELARSKRSFFAATLRKLQRAHYSGDTEVSQRILRQWGKRAPHQVKSLKNEDGVATKDEDEIGEVWTQHLVNVLGGHKETSVARCHAKPKRTVEEYSFWPTLPEVQNAPGKVNAKKALGPDGVGADVWRAGGETLARHILRSDCLGGNPYGNERIEDGRFVQRQRASRWGGQLPCVKHPGPRVEGVHRDAQGASAGQL